MPAATRRLSLAQAKEVVAQAASTGVCGQRVGLEIEGFPARPHPEVVAALGPVAFPGGSRLTFEPGGQVELSGPCFDTPAQACAALQDDLAAVEAAGVHLSLTGLSQHGSRPRVLDLPRYA